MSEMLRSVARGFFGGEGKRKTFKGNHNFTEEAEVLMKLLKHMDLRYITESNLSQENAFSRKQSICVLNVLICNYFLKRLYCSSLEQYLMKLVNIMTLKMTVSKKPMSAIYIY